MYPYLPETMVADRRRDLIVEASRSRLAALATCCRTSRWARAVRRLRDVWTALTAPSDGSCCATV